MTVLVLGASGYAGLAVTRALSARGLTVRAFIRNPDAEAVVRAAGASEVVRGDLRDLRAVALAADGADGVFFIGPRHIPDEAAIGKAVIDVAVATGVRRFVYSGVYHPTIRPLLNHQSKREIEDHLYKTDLEFVVLQPARFMHGLLLASWNRIVDDGVLTDSFAPGVKMAYVDYNDVAEVAAIAFAEQRLVRGSFELAADGQYTLHEVALLLGDELGHDVSAEQVAWDELSAQRRGVGSPYSAEAFQRLRAYYNQHGFHGGNSLVLRSILGREPRSIVGFWREEAARQRGALSVAHGPLDPA